MKKLVVLYYLFSTILIYGQSPINQVYKKVKTLPSNQKILVRSFEDNQVKNENLSNASNFKLPNKIEKQTVVAYDTKILKPTKLDLEVNYKKLPSKLKLNAIFPEYHLAPNGNESFFYSPIIVNSKLLTYDTISNAYKSKISFMLFCENHDSGKLKEPIDLEIVSNNLEIDKQKIQISHVNLPLTEVSIQTKNATDIVDLNILTKTNAPNGYKYSLEVNPVLRFNSNRKTIQGFGIQKIPISLGFKGTKSNKKEQISVASSKGHVTPSKFELAYNEIKTVEVRSEGIGNLKIKATSTSSHFNISDSNTIVIKQTFPWLFLLFALLGGMIGIAIRLGYDNAKQYPKKLIIGGVLMGLIGSLAYYVLGINFLKLNMSLILNEFAVLTFSALCAIVLEPILLKKNTFNETTDYS